MQSCEFDPNGNVQWISESELLSRNYTSFGIGFHFGRPEDVAWDKQGWPVYLWSRARVERHEAEVAFAGRATD